MYYQFFFESLNVLRFWICLFETILYFVNSTAKMKNKIQNNIIYEILLQYGDFILEISASFFSKKVHDIFYDNS